MNMDAYPASTPSLYSTDHVAHRIIERRLTVRFRAIVQRAVTFTGERCSWHTMAGTVPQTAVRFCVCRPHAGLTRIQHTSRPHVSTIATHKKEHSRLHYWSSL